jgi:hypothetical protein
MLNRKDPGTNMDLPTIQNLLGRHASGKVLKGFGEEA